VGLLEVVRHLERSDIQGDPEMKIAISLSFVMLVLAPHCQLFQSAWERVQSLPGILAQAERAVSR
jgi:hypothetical protein